jgi:hypothetical protein
MMEKIIPKLTLHHPAAYQIKVPGQVFDPISDWRQRDHNLRR